MVPTKICIIGCGTIGRELALAIDSGKVRGARLVALFDIIRESAEKLKGLLINSNLAIFSNFLELTASSQFDDADLVIEAASQDGAKKYSKSLLAHKKDLLLMSAGALADESFFSQLSDLVVLNRSRIYVPSGAIAGIDAIRSVKEMLDSVTLTTTKHPKALEGAPFFVASRTKLKTIRKKTLVFQGTAAEAVANFPANINVAAVLSLAGIGIDKTRVKIIADPNIRVNKHEIQAIGTFGKLALTVRNIPSPNNPKTSILAVLSAIECLRSICEPGIKVGT